MHFADASLASTTGPLFSADDLPEGKILRPAEAIKGLYAAFNARDAACVRQNRPSVNPERKMGRFPRHVTKCNLCVGRSDARGAWGHSPRRRGTRRGDLDFARVPSVREAV